MCYRSSDVDGEKMQLASCSRNGSRGMATIRATITRTVLAALRSIRTMPTGTFSKGLGLIRRRSLNVDAPDLPVIGG